MEAVQLPRRVWREGAWGQSWVGLDIGCDLKEEVGGGSSVLT